MCNYFEKEAMSGMPFKAIVGHIVFILVEIVVLYLLFR